MTRIATHSGGFSLLKRNSASSSQLGGARRQIVVARRPIEADIFPSPYRTDDGVLRATQQEKKKSWGPQTAERRTQTIPWVNNGKRNKA